MVDLILTMTLADGKEITSSTDITEDVKEAFTVGVTTHVILDLVVRYDEMSGLTITLKEWKPGSGGYGDSLKRNENDSNSNNNDKTLV